MYSISLKLQKTRTLFSIIALLFSPALFCSAPTSLDTSFNSFDDTTTTIGSTPSTFGIAIQVDGKSVVVGKTYSPNYVQEIFIARYNVDQTLDTTFNSSGSMPGVVTTLIGDQCVANDIALQADGKIVVTGYAQFSGINNILVVRYNTDGSLDTTFGSESGYTTTAIGSDALGHAVTIQVDGKIVVAGNLPYPSPYPLAVVRYLPNGLLDTVANGGSGFGTDGQGYITTAIPGSNQSIGTDIALQSDGKIVVTGLIYLSGVSVIGLVRYNTNGLVDETFNNNLGYTTTLIATQTTPTRMVIQSVDKIIVVGNSLNATFVNGTYNNVYSITLARYTSTGVLDTESFGTPNGYVTTTIGQTSSALDVALQPNGQIVITGIANKPSTSNLLLAYYNTDGTLDTTFNQTGYITQLVLSSCQGNAIAIKDGNIMIAGLAATITQTANPNPFDPMPMNTYVGQVLLAHYNSTGYETTSIGSYSVANACASQSDNKLVVAGYANLNGINQMTIARYLPNGFLDVTLGGTGYVTTPLQADAFTSNIITNNSAQTMFVTFYGTINGIANTPLNSPAISVPASGNTPVLAGAQSISIGVGSITINADHSYTIDEHGTWAQQAPRAILDENLTRTNGLLTNNGTQTATNLIFYNSSSSQVGSTVSSLTANNSVTIPTSAVYATLSDIFSNLSSVLTIPVSSSVSSNIFTANTITNNSTQGISVYYHGTINGTSNSYLNNPSISISVSGSIPIITGATTLSAQTPTQPIISNASIASGTSYNINNNSGVWSMTPVTMSRTSSTPIKNYSQTRSTTFTNNFSENTTDLVFYDANGTALTSAISLDAESSTAIPATATYAQFTDTIDSNSYTLTIPLVSSLQSAIAHAVAVQTDGKIVTAGIADNQIIVARYLTDGTLDAAFNGTGYVMSSIGTSSIAYGIAIQSDGKIVITGNSELQSDLMPLLTLLLFNKMVK